jgi:hypothetical protein
MRSMLRLSTMKGSLRVKARRQQCRFSSTDAPISPHNLSAIFPVEAFSDPWTNDWVSPLIGHDDLDKRSRFVIQLLQERFHGLPPRPDKATPYAVYNVLQRLLRDKRGKATEEVGRAHRADCILQACELFYDQYHDKDLPHPTANNYRTVLSLYAKEKNITRATPLRCLDILRRMNQRYTELSDESMKLTALLYLPVFACWNKSDDEHKAAEAFQLWKELRPQGLVDIHSYEQVLEACASNVELAQRVWTDRAEEVTSRAYAAYMASLRNVANANERDELLLSTFMECGNTGHVDRLCLEEIYRGSPTLWNKVVLRVTDGKWTGDQSQAVPHVLLNKLPTRWTRNAKPVE